MFYIRSVPLVLSYIIKISILFSLIVFLLQQMWLYFFLSGLALGLITLPIFLKRNYRVHLPLEFELILTIFVYSSIILGEIHQFYFKFWWWDLILHTTAGLMFGMIGFLLIYILNKENKADIHMSPVFVWLFSFMFAVAIGSLWEIFEFVVDLTLGTNMQKSGLPDTMEDMIVNNIGAFIVSIAGGLYVKKINVPLFDKLMDKFKNKNPRYFK